MGILNHVRRTGRLASLCALAVLSAASCTLGDPEAPTPSGPSSFALSVTMTATPDVLPRNGTAQSVVRVTVRDESGRPKAGQRLALGVSGPSGTSLSQSEVTTGSDGTATFTVRAPAQSAVGSSVITVSATPVGTNFNDAIARTITIALAGLSNTTAPVPAFTVDPESPEAGQVATFDASATEDEGEACLDACTYRWNFDDGTLVTGRIVTHRFQTGRDHTVTLTVTDAAGLSADVRRLVSVSAIAAPTVSFTMTPSPAVAGQAATFTATATAAPGHSVQSYRWNWGDGSGETTTTTPSATHTFGSAGTYVVTVTATDDTGQTGQTSSSVTVESGVSAAFTFSPTNPTTNTTVQFNGTPSSSTGGASITQWSWDFGDGTVITDNDPTAAHQFADARTYVVRLTVTDSNGRTGTTTQNVTVTTP